MASEDEIIELSDDESVRYVDGPPSSADSEPEDEDKNDEDDEQQGDGDVDEGDGESRNDNDKQARKRQKQLSENGNFTLWTRDMGDGSADFWSSKPVVFEPPPNWNPEADRPPRNVFLSDKGIEAVTIYLRAARARKAPKSGTSGQSSSAASPAQGTGHEINNKAMGYSWRADFDHNGRVLVKRDPLGLPAISKEGDIVKWYDKPLTGSSKPVPGSKQSYVVSRKDTTAKNPLPYIPNFDTDDIGQYLKSGNRAVEQKLLDYNETRKAARKRSRVDSNDPDVVDQSGSYSSNSKRKSGDATQAINTGSTHSKDDLSTDLKSFGSGRSNALTQPGLGFSTSRNAPSMLGSDSNSLVATAPRAWGQNSLPTQQGRGAPLDPQVALANHRQRMKRLQEEHDAAVRSKEEAEQAYYLLEESTNKEFDRISCSNEESLATEYRRYKELKIAYEKLQKENYKLARDNQDLWGAYREQHDKLKDANKEMEYALGQVRRSRSEYPREVEDKRQQSMLLEEVQKQNLLLLQDQSKEKLLMQQQRIDYLNGEVERLSTLQRQGQVPTNDSHGRSNEQALQQPDSSKQPTSHWQQVENGFKGHGRELKTALKDLRSNSPRKDGQLQQQQSPRDKPPTTAGSSQQPPSTNTEQQRHEVVDLTAEDKRPGTPENTALVIRSQPPTPAATVPRSNASVGTPGNATDRPRVEDDGRSNDTDRDQDDDDVGNRDTIQFKYPHCVPQ